MRALLAIFGAELRTTVRNRQRVVVGFLSPIVMMLLIGWAFGQGQPLTLPIGVVDQDGSRLSRTLISQLRAHESQGIRLHVGSFGDEIAGLRSGNRRLVIVIPPGFEATTLGFETPLIAYEDPSDPGNAKLALTVMQAAVTEMRTTAGLAGGSLVERRSVGGGRRLAYLDFLAPGLLGMGAMNIALMGAIGSLVQYRERGILRRIRATPVPLWAFVAGSSAVSVLLALIQVFVLLGIAIGAFHVQIIGSWPALVLIVVVGNIVFVGLGVVISSIANTFQSAQAIVVAVMVPMLFLSGTFFETDGIPAFLQPVVQVLPLTHLVDALRDVALRGGSLSSVGPQIAILLTGGVIAFLASLRVFRWE